MVAPTQHIDFSDLFAAVWLVCLGHVPQYIPSGGMVIIRFPESQKLHDDLALYSQGESLPANQLFETYRMVKGRVLSMKRQGAEHYGNSARIVR